MANDYSSRPGLEFQTRIIKPGLGAIAEHGFVLHNHAMSYLDIDFFARDTISVARDLIGATLIVGECEGRIVETEAYTTDPASHAVTRPRQAAAMRDTYGHVYVYLIYGMYYCLNFTTELAGVGAVLIRAAEPRQGLELMMNRRGQVI